MSSKQLTIDQYYQSRKTILQYAKKRGFNINDYDNFSMNELRSMIANKQLDMIFENEKGNKLFVKYNLAKSLRPSNMNDLVDDVYNIDNVIGPNDELIIIIKENINETLLSSVNSIYQNKGIFLTIFSIGKLCYNLLEHELVPDHSIYDNINEIRDRYNIVDDSNFPEISRHDPVAKAIGLRPKQLCEITRNSKTTISAKYYRLCI